MRDGRSYKATRISAYPTDAGRLGHYQASVSTGSMAAGLAASSDILQFRWARVAEECAIYSVKVTGMRASTAFTAGPIDISLFTARSWTVDGSGGATISVFSNRQKLDTRFGASWAGQSRISTTAALTQGTRTLDTSPVGEIKTHSSAGPFAATPIIGSIHLPHNVLFYADIASGQSPLVLGNSEGIVVQASVPGTGVWVIGFEIKWIERQVDDIEVA